MTIAALLAWTGCQGRCHGQEQACFQCRLRERAASLVRFLVHLGMRAAAVQSSSRPLLLCTAIQTASRCPRVPDVKGRHFGSSMIVGEGGQLYDFGAWLKVRTQCFQSCPKNFHSKNAADDVQKTRTAQDLVLFAPLADRYKE